MSPGGPSLRNGDRQNGVRAQDQTGPHDLRLKHLTGQLLVKLAYQRRRFEIVDAGRKYRPDLLDPGSPDVLVHLLDDVLGFL